MAINFGVGQCVDIFMRAGEMSCSMPLENDRWVLATIALAKEDRILVHVSGGSARWLPRQSAELAMPGVYTGGGGLGRAASHARERPVVDIAVNIPTNYLVAGVKDELATPDEQRACEAAQNVHTGEKRKRPTPQ